MTTELQRLALATQTHSDCWHQTLQLADTTQITFVGGSTGTINFEYPESAMLMVSFVPNANVLSLLLHANFQGAGSDTKVHSMQLFLKDNWGISPNIEFPTIISHSSTHNYIAYVGIDGNNIELTFSEDRSFYFETDITFMWSGCIPFEPTLNRAGAGEQK